MPTGALIAISIVATTGGACVLATILHHVARLRPVVPAEIKALAEIHRRAGMVIAGAAATNRSVDELARR